MKKLIYTLTALFISLFLLSSCASVIKNIIDDPSNLTSAEPLSLHSGYEITHIRADFIRNIEVKEKVDVEKNGTKTVVRRDVKKTPNPYHDLAVYFGNGIMLDMNNNLSLDLLKFYGLDKASAFRIIRKPRDIGKPKMEYTLSDGKFTRKEIGILGAKATVRFHDNEIQIDDGILKLKNTITIDPDELVYKPFGLTYSSGIIKISDTEYQFAGATKEGDFRLSAPGTITLDDKLEISAEGNKTVFTYNMGFGITKKYTFVRTKDGCIFYDNKYYRGTEVRKEDNLIKIIVNGNTEYQYEIIEMEQ